MTGISLLVTAWKSKLAERIAANLYDNMTLHKLMWIVRLVPVAVMLVLIIGFIGGSIWVGKEQDEMLRQMNVVLAIATGGK